jgi:hypothetical protein
LFDGVFGVCGDFFEDVEGLELGFLEAEGEDGVAKSLEGGEVGVDGGGEGEGEEFGRVEFVILGEFDEVVLLDHEGGEELGLAGVEFRDGCSRGDHEEKHTAAFGRCKGVWGWGQELSAKRWSFGWFGYRKRGVGGRLRLVCVGGWRCAAVQGRACSPPLQPHPAEKDLVDSGRGRELEARTNPTRPMSQARASNPCLTAARVSVIDVALRHGSPSVAFGDTEFLGV